MRPPWQKKTSVRPRDEKIRTGFLQAQLKDVSGTDHPKEVSFHERILAGCQLGLRVSTLRSERCEATRKLS